MVITDKQQVENTVKNTETYLCEDRYIKQEKTNLLPTGGAASSVPKVLLGHRALLRQLVQSKDPLELQAEPRWWGELVLFQWFLLLEILAMCLFAQQVWVFKHLYTKCLSRIFTSFIFIFGSLYKQTQYYWMFTWGQQIADQFQSILSSFSGGIFLLFCFIFMKIEMAYTFLNMKVMYCYCKTFTAQKNYRNDTNNYFYLLSTYQEGY